MNRFSRKKVQKRQAGFTLIEIMVVIVIVGILASLITLNMGGIDQRKALQSRELLVLDLKKINREANDQARIYALQTQAASNVAPFQYRLIEYQKQKMPTLTANQIIPEMASYQWQDAPEFAVRQLPEQVSFVIEAQQAHYAENTQTDLLRPDAPTLIWFGNGEAKPVTIQVYYAQRPVGEPITIDYLGKVDAQS